MALPNPNEADVLSNIFRLKGLKTASSRRKVMPGAQILNQMDELEQDLGGTAAPQNLPDYNEPQQDLGGEITPQSYDVRANNILTPEQENFHNNMLKMSRALPPLAPPIETQQTEIAEGLPPVNPEEESLLSYRAGLKKNPYQMIGEGIKKVYSPEGQAKISGTIRNALNEYTDPAAKERNIKTVEDARLLSAGINPQEVQDAEDEKEQAIQAQIEEAQKNPMNIPVYGATDKVANNPELQKEFRTYTGIDYSPEIDEQVKRYESVITGMDQELDMAQGKIDQQTARIKERIDANAATDADKYYIGLALLMPLIVGGFFGKEAGLGALGGAAKGIADIYGRRGKETADLEEALTGLTKMQSETALKRGELEYKKAGIRQDVIKALPKDEKAFLKGKKEAVWVDPKTGQEKTGIVIKPGLVALPEFITSKEKEKELTKEANDINEAKTATQLINKLTSEIIDVSSKLENKGLIAAAMQKSILSKNPDLASRLTEEVEYEGRMVNSGTLLEHKIKLLTDAYRQAKGMRALTNTVQEHIDGLFANPTSSFRTFDDTIDQMLYTRNLAQENLINNATNQGFAPEFLEEEFGNSNKEVYERLNKKVRQKKSAQATRE